MIEKNGAYKLSLEFLYRCVFDTLHTTCFSSGVAIIVIIAALLRLSLSHTKKYHKKMTADGQSYLLKGR